VAGGTLVHVSVGTGSTRIGRYEVIKAIASGGMATVYLGRVVGAGGFERLVAIKSMHPHIQEDPEFVAMFMDEARLAALVRHPNVVPTIDVQEDPLFLVMEYVEGPSLHVVLRALKRKGETLPIGIGLRVIVDVLNGLHSAHDLKGTNGHFMQLVHRDVSPQNMLIGVDGIARITDFGVARAESRLSSTRGGQVKGKIGYMAPEQVRSEPADRRSDTYAAAVVLWELLAGRPLFMADNEGALVAQVAMGASRRPRDFVPTVPEAIEAVCMHALESDPAKRFASAAEFADAIEEAARAAGVAVANARAVATFVQELGAHEAPDAPARPSAHPLPAWSTPQPPDAKALARVETPSGATSTSALLASSEGAVIGRPRWQIPAAVASALVLGVGFAVVALRGPAPEPSPSPAATTSAALPSARVEPEPSATAPSPSASASASASSSSPPIGSAAPVDSAPRPLGGPGPRPGSPAGKPTSFRPNGL
jgi:serine/threonine protein kinase